MRLGMERGLGGEVIKLNFMDPKESVGKWAAEQVRDGMAVGLGTGSTAAYFVRHLARRVKDEGLKLQLSSSSLATGRLAEELGLSLVDMENFERLDLYADGADEVDPQKRLLKGRGAAMLREKVLAHAAKRFLVIVDAAKRVPRLGTNFPVPVEVFPLARNVVIRELKNLGADVVLRLAGDKKSVMTDQNNYVLDARFQPSVDLAALDGILDSIPGVVSHGIFARYAGRITVAVGSDSGVEVL